MGAGGGADAETRLQRSPDRLGTVGGHGASTALLGRAAQAGEDALPDHGPLEVGEDAQHAEHGPSRRGARVEALLVQVEVHALGLHIAEEGDEIGQGPPDAVHAPCGHDVDLPAGDALQEGVEGGSLIASLGAGDAFVGVDGGDHPSLPLGDLVEFS